MIKTKICGITNLDDALLASSYGASAVGFIFSKKSPRCISKDAAKKIIDKLDPFLVKVGVFLDQSKEEVFDIASSLGLDVLQFHGNESPSYCNSFRSSFKVIKVFFPEDRPYEEKINRYKVDALMFDIKYNQKQSQDQPKTLSHATLKEISQLIKANKRVIISGGLNVGNVTQVKKLHPFAIDVASGVEELVGKKDQELLKEFIRKVNCEDT